MSFARDVSNKVWFMDKGIIVEAGDAKEFFAHPKDARSQAYLLLTKEEAAKQDHI